MVEYDNIDDPNEWIEEAISKKHIKYYEYEYFSNIEEIGFGAFGKVYRANWRNKEQYLALKSFFNHDKATTKEIVEEVYMFFMHNFLLLFLSYINFSIKKKLLNLILVKTST
jgi:hypothetical protein